MRAFNYLLIGVILFYLDTTIGLLIPLKIFNYEIIFVPHLTLMYLLLLTIYRIFGVSILLAILLGIVTDIYVGSVYGINMFGYVLLVTVFDRLFKVFYRDQFLIFIVALLCTLLFEIYEVIIYGILGLIDFNLWQFILLRLIPTLLINFILLSIIFPILLKYFKKIKLKIDSSYTQ